MVEKVITEVHQIAVVLVVGLMNVVTEGGLVAIADHAVVLVCAIVDGAHVAVADHADGKGAVVRFLVIEVPVGTSRALKVVHRVGNAKACVGILLRALKVTEKLRHRKYKLFLL